MDLQYYNTGYKFDTSSFTSELLLYRASFGNLELHIYSKSIAKRILTTRQLNARTRGVNIVPLRQ